MTDPKFRLAVIDDHTDFRNILRVFLQDEYFISDFLSASEFLPSINESYDLILSDLSMPEMDGFELLKHLQSQENLSKIPVIAMTAHAGDFIKHKALAAGFRACFSKPFDLAELSMTIKECLSVRSVPGTMAARRNS